MLFIISSNIINLFLFLMFLNNFCLLSNFLFKRIEFEKQYLTKNGVINYLFPNIYTISN